MASARRAGTHLLAHAAGICICIYTIHVCIYTYRHIYMYISICTCGRPSPRRPHGAPGGAPAAATHGAPPPTAPPLQPLRGRRLPRLGRGSLQQQRLALTASPRFPLPKQMLPFLWQFFATKAFENSTCTLRGQSNYIHICEYHDTYIEKKCTCALFECFPFVRPTSEQRQERTSQALAARGFGEVCFATPADASSVFFLTA